MVVIGERTKQVVISQKYGAAVENTYENPLGMGGIKKTKPRGLSEDRDTRGIPLQS